MAAVVRLFLFLTIYLLLSLATARLSPQHQLLSRDKATVTDINGVISVFDPSSHASIPQSPATDAGGTAFNLPALIWVGFSLAIGIPMACAGARGWRLTTGVAIGLAAAVCSWAAFINTVDAPGIPDIVLTFIVLAFFFLGFVLGVFEFARLGAIVLLGLCGGVAFGVRVVLVKEGLLFSQDGLYVINWVIVAVFAAAGGLVLIWTQRIGVLFGCASVGTFLTFLGIDLIMSKQTGMSRGLRFLFDRNDSHFADILGNGYSPSITTKVLIFASLALTPVLAFAQHKIFKDSFIRKRPISDGELGADFFTPEKQSNAFLDTKLKAPSRFSL